MSRPNSFFGKISVKASTPERKFAVDQAWFKFMKGQVNNADDVLEIISREFREISYEKGISTYRINEEITHFATKDNAEKMLKLFKMVRGF